MGGRGRENQVLTVGWSGGAFAECGGEDGRVGLEGGDEGARRDVPEFEGGIEG